MASERKIKVLVVTPEITYIPTGMGNISSHLSAKAGGMADVSATLVNTLYNLGADVHVAIPHYRHLYKTDYTNKEEANQKMLRDVIQGGESDHVKRVHLASSRLFDTSNRVYGCTTDECLQRSLAFQREVINTIIPEVNPDLIHCNDWMTGLIPSFARILGIRSLFTVHNIHTVETTLERIEDYEIDTKPFWTNLYYTHLPSGYDESRRYNRVDLLASGIFGAHFINTVSPTQLRGRHSERAGSGVQSRQRHHVGGRLYGEEPRGGEAPEQARLPAGPRPAGKRGRAVVLLAVTPRPRPERAAVADGDHVFHHP